MLLPKPNRGWFLGAAGMIAAWILERIEAPIWLAVLTFAFLLAGALMWPWIQQARIRRRLFWLVLSIYSVFVVLVTSYAQPSTKLNQPETKEPKSFLEIAAVKILTNELTVGAPLSMNVGYVVHGTQPIRDMYFSQSIAVVTYEPADQPRLDVEKESERSLHETVRQIIKNQESEIAVQGLNGQQVGLGVIVFRTVNSSPLTQEQEDGIVSGKSRVYLTSWAIWKDSEGRAGKLETCQWLQTPPSRMLSNHDPVWHVCVWW